MINLRTNPGWYLDEGCNLNIASNLLNGQLRLFSVPYYFFPRLPLYPLLIALSVKLLGTDILAIRIPSMIFGALTGIFVYLAGKELYGKRVGALSLALFALFPLGILSGRLGLSFGFLSLLSFFTYYCCLRYMSGKSGVWIVLASLAAGLSLVTEIFGLAVIASLVIFLIVFERKRFFQALVISLLPAACFIAVMLICFRDGFVSQVVNFSGARIFGPNPLYGTAGLANPSVIAQTASGFLGLLLCGGAWTAIGTIGFFLIGKTREARFLSLTNFILLSLGISLATGKNGDRFFITTFPFMMLGLAGIAAEEWKVLPFLKSRDARSLSMIIPAILIVLLVAMSAGDYRNLLDFKSRSLVLYPEDAIAAADYINNNLEGPSLVVADSNLSWLIRAPAVEIIDVVAYTDRSQSFPFREIYPGIKFDIDASIGKVKFVLLNYFVNGFYSFFPSVVDLELKIRRTWREVYSNENYVVYENPGLR